MTYSRVYALKVKVEYCCTENGFLTLEVHNSKSMPLHEN